MNTNTIVCPKCKAEIPLTDAVTHGIREQLEKEFTARQRTLQDSVDARELALAERQKQIAQAEKTIEQQVAAKVAAERKTLQAEAREEAKQGLTVEMQDLRNQLADRQQKLADAQKAELELRKQQREVEQRAQTLELEVARKLDAERETIRKQAAETATEAERLKVAEKEKVISDLQLQITALKQKAEQGSMQLQGEVLELDLEDQLAAAFPHDTVEPVSKGVKGGDIHQRVRTNTGHDCGMILWEAKRTKNWSGNWAPKLKEDQRTAKAELAVIISQVLPPELKHFGQVEGVWVCDFLSALPLAAALRHGLVTAAMARLAETGKAGKMEELYAYLCGLEFRQHVEAVVESFAAMQQDLQKERRAAEKAWAAREKQLGRALQHTAQLYGGIQGIAGQTALPEIKALELPAGDAPGAATESSAV
jgi:hypothetical protein